VILLIGRRLKKLKVDLALLRVFALSNVLLAVSTIMSCVITALHKKWCT
jgi:hypothetical protein